MLQLLGAKIKIGGVSPIHHHHQIFQFNTSTCKDVYCLWKYIMSSSIFVDGEELSYGEYYLWIWNGIFTLFYF
jgi:hypothetical protein